MRAAFRTPLAAVFLAFLLGPALACAPAGDPVGDESSDDAPSNQEVLEPATPSDPDAGLPDVGELPEGDPAPGAADADVPAGFEDTVQQPEDEPLNDSLGERVETPGAESLGSSYSEPRELKSVWLHLIAPADDGASAAGQGRGSRQRPQGEVVGCGDRVVAVEVPMSAEVSSPEESIRAALETLLALRPGAVPGGLTHPLSRSRLTVDRVEAVPARDGSFRVFLNGQLRLDGDCDAPRIRAQIVGTASRFAGVEEVEVFLGERPLDAVLSARNGE